MKVVYCGMFRFEEFDAQDTTAVWSAQPLSAFDPGSSELHVDYTKARVFEGHFKQGKKHGEGKYTESDSTTYKGKWNNGYKTGLFTIEIINKEGKREVLIGGYKDGKKM